MRRGPHTQATIIWQGLFASLLIDPLIPLMVTPRLPRDEALQMATIFALGCLPFLAQRRVHSILSGLRHLHTRSLETNSQSLPLLLGLGVFAIFAVKALLLSHFPIIVSASILALALVGCLKYLVNVKRQALQDRELFENNPWAKVQRWEHQVLVFAILPLLLARLISTSGAFAESAPGEDLERVIFLGVSAIFLGMLRPDRSFFVGMCPRCKHPVPIVFQDLGSCLNCSTPLQHAYYAWVNGITPLPPSGGDPIPPGPQTGEGKDIGKGSGNNPG